MLVNQLQPILAAWSFNDWFEILFLVLIFGGSALGTVLKKLIAHFSPDEQDNTPAQTPSPTPSIRPRTPSTPSARPMTMPTPGTSMESFPPIRPPGESTGSLRPVVGYPKPEKLVRPARPVRPAPSSSMPPVPMPRQASQAQTRSRRQPLEVKSEASSPKVRARPKQTKVKEKDHHQHGLLVDLHESGEELVEDVVVSQQKLSSRARLLGTRASLRDAIMLSEILAPPLAMRDPSKEAGK